MATEASGETVDLAQLALQFLEGAGVPPVGEADENAEEVVEPAAGSNEHPAWTSILDAVPAEYHDALMHDERMGQWR